MKSGKKTVYYDAECPMCQAFQSKVVSSKQSDKFTFVDVNTGSLPAEISKEVALQQMHVVDEYGVVYKNSDSVLAVLHEYKNVRWLVHIGRLPVLRNILRIGYKWVARNRYSIFNPSVRFWCLKLPIVVFFIVGLYVLVRFIFS